MVYYTLRKGKKVLFFYSTVALMEYWSYNEKNKYLTCNGEKEYKGHTVIEYELVSRGE